MRTVVILYGYDNVSMKRIRWLRSRQDEVIGGNLFFLHELCEMVGYVIYRRYALLYVTLVLVLFLF